MRLLRRLWSVAAVWLWIGMCVAPHAQELPLLEEPPMTQPSGDLTDFLQSLESGYQITEIVDILWTRAQGDLDDPAFQSAVLWLRARVMADDTPDPAYALLYARILMHESRHHEEGVKEEDISSLQETAVLSWLYGRLTLLVDARRCMQGAVARGRAEALLTPLRPIEEIYWTQTPSVRQDLLAVAMRLEDRALQRPPNDVLCLENPEMARISRLARASRTPVQNLKETGTIRRFDVFEKEFLSLVDDLESSPLFVPRVRWLVLRDDVRREFSEEFSPTKKETALPAFEYPE